MIRRLTGLLVISLMLATAWSPAEAQVGASEVNGTVVDAQGEPVAGAQVVFNPRREPDRVYKGKTNKKGRYYVQGLWTPSEDNFWVMTVDADGYVPTHIRIESRTVNRVLVGQIMDEPLSPGSKIPEFAVTKMGRAQVDVTLSTEEEVQQMIQETQVLASGSGEGGEAAVVQQPKKDPWLDATMLANAGEYELSLPLFEEAIEEQPEDVVRHETYAKILAHLGRYEDAAAAAAKAVELDPERLECRLVQSQVYIKMGEMDQARAVLEAAQQLAPDDMRIWEQRIYIAQQGGDVDEQIAVYRAVTEVQPDHLESWLALGDLYAKTGDLDASADAYAKVVAIDPDNAYRTYYNIAVLILNREQRSEADTQRAIDALRRAVEINADYGPAWHELGVALLGQGDMTGAVSALETYLRVSPDAPDAADLRALVANLKK